MSNPTQDPFMQDLMASANYDIRAILGAIAANPGVSIQEFCNIAKGIDEVSNVSSTEDEAYIEFCEFNNHHEFTVYKDSDGKLVLDPKFCFAFDDENNEDRIFEYDEAKDLVTLKRP